jgi:dienelactone hydrolase
MATGVSFLQTAALVLSVVCSNALLAFQPMTIAGDPPLQVQWQPAEQSGRRPVVIALHGCSGLYTSRGTVDNRYTSYAKRWNATGWHVVAPDSFGSRNSGAICAHTPEQRAIKVAHRREDVLRTAAWLVNRDDVDASRIAVVGWSHGAMTALEVLDRKRWPEQRPVAIVAYYPSCSAWQRRALVEPAAPLLMLLGDADDWTPSAPCKAFAERLQAVYPGIITMRAYEDSHHGFDSSGRVRFLPDIPAGNDRRGVHVGGNPAAREASLGELDRFLSQYLQQ